MASTREPLLFGGEANHLGEENRYGDFDPAVKMSPGVFWITFLQWLGTVWVNENDAPLYDEDVSAFKTFALISTFRRSFADGAWRNMMRPMTVEELHLMNQIMDNRPRAQMTAGKYNQHAWAPRVRRLLTLDADKLVHGLGQYFITLRQVGAPTLPVQAMVHDGVTGHCITVTDLTIDHRFFVYMDGWPERSLLCAENNVAGVDAQPFPQWPFWAIKPTELATIIVSAICGSYSFPALSASNETFRDFLLAARFSAAHSPEHPTDLSVPTHLLPFAQEANLSRGERTPGVHTALARARLADLIEHAGDVSEADWWRSQASS
jgi:hypothetical protein